MLTLCVETTNARYFLGVSRAGELVASTQGVAGRTLDTEIFAALKSVMTQGEASVEDIGNIAVGVGPGSFVGTRIGLALANTLARVRGVPVLGIGAHDALACLGPQDEDARFYCALNCVRDEVFWQPFVHHDGVPSPCGEIDVCPFDSFAELCGGRPVIFRASALRNTLRAETIATLPGVTLVDDEAVFEALARLAHVRSATTAANARSLPTPRYVKPETTRIWNP